MFKVLLLFPIFISAEKHIGSVMVSALALSAVDRGLGHGWVKLKTVRS